MTIQAALYARVSSEQQATAQTIASQLAELRQRMQTDGCRPQVELEFIDEGVSGATLIRPALERLRDMVAFGSVDRLYVHSPDRLSRKYAYQVLLCDEFQRASVEVVFLNRALGQTPEDDLLLQVQGMVAEYERAKILERSRRGKRHKAQTGQVSVLSGAPYGYRYISVYEGSGEARYEIVPNEAQTVRQVFAWVGEKRVSLHEVCRRLKQQGVPTRCGKATWDAKTIHGMLNNPAYRGQAAFGKTHLGPPHPALRLSRNQRVPAAQTTNAVPSEQWQHIPVPAIVDEDAFAAAQAQLAENRKHMRTRRRGARYLLQGLLVCRQCGYAFYGKPVSNSSAKGHVRDYAYYRCLGTDAYRYGGQRICNNRQVRTDYLERAVWHEVRGLLEQPERVVQEYQRRLQALAAPNQNATQASVEKQFNQCRRSITRLIDSYADGYLERDEFEPRVAQLKKRRAGLAQQLKELNDATQTQTELQLIIGRLDEFGAKVRTGLDEMDWMGRRELIRTLVKRVEIEYEQVNVVFRIPPSLPYSPTSDYLQHCGRREHATLRCADAVGFTTADILSGAVLVLFDDRRFEPHFDQVQNRTVNNALGYDSQQFGVGNAVEVFRQVGINDMGVAIIERFGYLIYSITGRFLWPESVGIRTEIGFKYRLDDELGRHLDYPITDRRYPERAQVAIRFGNHNAPYRTWLVGLVFQILGQFQQKRVYPNRLLYVLEVSPINAGTSFVGANKPVSKHEDVCPPYLVVERIEAIGRFLLGLGIELPL
jgi:site-specific DNA recombinase